MREQDTGDRSWLERTISSMERTGLNAARLILGLGASAAVAIVIGCLIGLIIEGVDYDRAVNPSKYRIEKITFVPKFSNLLLSGKPQMDGDAINEDRVAAESRTRAQLVSDRLAYMTEVGLCISKDGKCDDLATQRNNLADNWRTADIQPIMPPGSTVVYANGMNIPDLSPYYGAFGFSEQEGALKAEWDAVNACIGAYKVKNGNLYLQKAPELFNAVAAECDRDYDGALTGELKTRPANWTVVDSAQVYALGATTGGLFLGIILIAMTIILFRLEVSFRALRNLDRLP
jgi:hypothetical protein